MSDFAATLSTSQVFLNRSPVVSEENIGRVLSGNRILAILGHPDPVFGPAEITDLYVPTDTRTTGDFPLGCLTEICDSVDPSRLSVTSMRWLVYFQIP